MATFTETITAETIAAKDGQFIAYNQTFVAGTPFLQPNGQPVQWFSYILGDELDLSVVTTDAISLINGFVKFDVTAASGLALTLELKVGDYVYWTPNTDVIPQYVQVTEVIEQTATRLVFQTDLTNWTDLTIDTAEPLWVCYFNRLDRLRPFVVTDGTREYKPNYTALLVNVADPVTALPEQAISIDLEQIAISWFPPARPFYADADRNRNVTVLVKYGLAADPYSESDDLSINNALEFAVSSGGFSWNSGILNGIVYNNAWQLPDCRVVQVGLYVLDSNTTPVGIEPYNAIAGGYPLRPLTKTNLVGPRPMWIAWQSRYGGYDVWCFNYDQTDTVKTTSYGQYRQGYANYDLGKQAVRSLALNSGLVGNEYEDWFVDLQNSNKVWFTTDVFIAQSGSVNFINHDQTDWQECTIDDMQLIVSAQNTSLIEFMCTITFVQMLKSYRS